MTFSLDRFSGFLLLPLLVFGSAAGAATQSGIVAGHKKETLAGMRNINDVKEAHVNALMALTGVVGVYVSALQDGTPCIKVMVVKTTPELEKQIPRSLEGHPVLIIETGEIKPLSANPLPS